MSIIKENMIEIFIYMMLLFVVSYSVYDAIDQKSFDSACDLTCGDTRSATPIIDFRNQCLCDMGHGKWQVKDVRTN